MSNALGPWYVAKTGNHQGLVCNEQTGENIAVTYKSENAHLVAASPSMFSALELAEGWIDAKREDETTGEGQQAKWILDTIRAAISEAKEG